MKPLPHLALSVLAATPATGAQNPDDYCGIPPRTDLLPLGGIVDPPAALDPPPRWYSGDTHEHVQLCPLDQGPPPIYPPDATPEEIYAQLQAQSLNVSNAMVWIPRSTTPVDFLVDYAPLVTGDEHEVTAADANHVFQFCLETSGAPRPSALGHISALNIDDAFYDLTVDYPALAADYFNAQPNAVVGYAHQGWPVGLVFPGVAIQLAPAIPFLAPFDAVLGKIDFLESIDLEFAGKLSAVPEPWYGLYYKLLAAGVPMSISGGSDTNCITTLSGLEMRTWVRIESEPLTYDKWTAGLAAGRVTLSLGPAELLDLSVQGQPIGDRVYVEEPGTLQVAATIHVTDNVPFVDTIEIVQDREVVASQFLDLPDGGQHVVEFLVPVSESGWVAARSSRTHTGAVYVHVGMQPIADLDVNEYWITYHDALRTFAFGLMVTNPEALEAFVGSSFTEIIDYMASARVVYATRRDLSLPLPAGMTRLGRSSPACRGPIAIVAPDPAVAGEPLTLRCLDGPPGAPGVLGVGQQSVPGGFALNGAILYVHPVPPPRLIGTVANEAGFASVDVDVPPTAAGVTAFAQFAWANTVACPGAGTFSSSDALSIVVQP